MQYGSVSLSLDQLVADGVIDDALAARLTAYRKSGLAGPLVSVLYILGALAVAAGVVALVPTATTGLVLAIVALAGGWAMGRLADASYRILSLGLATTGALGLAGWFALEFGDVLSPITVNGVVTLIVLAVAVAFRSHFLAALVPLGIGAMLGSGTAYWHATYAIFVREPLITTLLFGALVLGLVHAVDRNWLPRAYAAMAEVAMRMSFVLANLGLWVGSLWGDRVGEHLAGVREHVVGESSADRRDRLAAWREDALTIPDEAFVVGWLALAAAAIVWGGRTNRRFVAVGGVVFLAINAYTQFFAHFRFEAGTLVLAGVSMVALAIGLVRYGRKI